MNYEPTGRVKPFVDEVRREPGRVWSPAEVAIMLGAPQSSVGSWLDYPMKQKAIYRGKRAGQVVYSGQPFPPEAAFPHPAVRNAAAPADDLTIPKFGAYVPPRMTAPRAGSDVALPSRAPGAPPAAARAVLDPIRVLPHRPALTEAPTPAPSPAPTPAPTPRFDTEVLARLSAAWPAPVTAEIVETEDEVAAEEPAEEEAQPDAFVSCRTGEIIVVGIEPDDEGRITLPSDLVSLIKRQIAWSPGR